MPLFKSKKNKAAANPPNEGLTESEQQPGNTNNHHKQPDNKMPVTPSSQQQARPSPNDPLPGAVAGQNQPAPQPGQAAAKPAQQQQQQLVFLCQLAHGSPTGRITGFTNVRQLYEKISDAFDMPPTEVSLNFKPKLTSARKSRSHIWRYCEQLTDTCWYILYVSRHEISLAWNLYYSVIKFLSLFY